MQNSAPAIPAARLIQNSAAARDVMLVLLFGALTALSAQISIPLKPVPFTAQVLLVLLSGALLGPRLGFMSQVTYLCFGLMGAPVFAEGKSTILTVMGPTGGYLLSYPLAAAMAGWASARVRSLGGLVVGLLVSSLLILGLGGLWLGCGAALVHWPDVPAAGGFVNGLEFGWRAGVAPFILGDIVKTVVAAIVAWPLVRPRATD
jgi:biotin transport system substrate-specific component